MEIFAEDSNFDDKISTIYHRLDFWAATAVFDREEDQREDRETKHLCLNIRREEIEEDEIFLPIFVILFCFYFSLA